MRKWLLAAVATASLAASASAVSAADLNYSDPPQRYGSAYDDPRYADLYGYQPPPPPPPPVPERRYYGEQYGYNAVPIPREPVYRDAPPPPRYRTYAERPGCAPKDEVRYRLERDGWTGFQDAQVLDANTAYVKARRHNGRLYGLRIDRCSGDIVEARPIEPRGLPYADRRYDRSYY